MSSIANGTVAFLVLRVSVPSFSQFHSGFCNVRNMSLNARRIITLKVALNFTFLFVRYIAALSKGVEAGFVFAEKKKISL